MQSDLFFLSSLSDRQKGAVYMLMACFMQAIFSTCCKTAIETTSQITICFFSFGTSLLVQLWLLRKKPLSFFYTKKIHLHITRALFGITASLLFVFSLKY